MSCHLFSPFNFSPPYISFALWIPEREGFLVILLQVFSMCPIQRHLQARKLRELQKAATDRNAYA